MASNRQVVAEDTRIRGCKISYDAGGLKFYMLDDAAPPSTRIQNAEFPMETDIEKDTHEAGFAAKRKKESSSTLPDLDSACILEGSFSL
jgi:hypothetical protein